MASNVMSQLTAWLDVAPKTPPRKKGPQMDGSKGESAKRVLSPTDRHHNNPFDHRESEWLKGTLGAVASTLSEAFDKRVTAVEQRITAVEQQASNTQCTTDAALDTAQRAVRDAREVKDIASEQFRSLEKQLALLSATTKNTSDEIAKIKASCASSSRGGFRPSAVAGSTAKASVPYRERTEGRIGNLGWDTEADVLLARGKEVLEKANVDPNSHSVVVAAVGRSGKGSACEVTFISPAALQAARLAVQTSAQSFVDSKIVWLDAQKEPEELRAARVIHRIAEMLNEMESARTPSLEVVKNMRGGYVTVGGTRAAYTLRGDVKWAAWAVNRYSEDERDWATSFSTN